jgi:hypothetical protein
VSRCPWRSHSCFAVGGRGAFVALFFQLLAVVRMRSWYTLARRKQHWGKMTRKGFGPLLPGGVGPVPGLDPTADPVLTGETPPER